MSDSKSVNGVDLNADYNQVQSDWLAQQEAYSQYDLEYQHMMVMIQEMDAGNMDPDLIINYFMYVMMPTILNTQEDSMTIMGDQLNVLSDYRGLNAKAQSDFNDFNNGGGTTEEYQDIEECLDAIKNGLNIDMQFADEDHLSGGFVLDSGTSTQISSAIDEINSTISNGAKKEFPDDYDQDPDKRSADYLNDLWLSSTQPEPVEGGNNWIDGASETIKGLGENFTTINTGSSTVSDGVQTEIQYQSSNYQQFLGLDNNFLQNRAKQVSALVQNQKTN